MVGFESKLNVATAIHANYGDTEPPLPGMAFGAPLSRRCTGRSYQSSPRSFKSKSQVQGGNRVKSGGRDPESLKKSISMDHYGLNLTWEYLSWGSTTHHMQPAKKRSRAQTGK